MGPEWGTLMIHTFISTNSGIFDIPELGPRAKEKTIMDSRASMYKMAIQVSHTRISASAKIQEYLNL